MKLPLFPEQASTTAAKVDLLYFVLSGTSLFFVLLIFVPMTFFLFKYRRGQRANRSALRISTTRIEIIWTAIPLFLAMGIFAWAAHVYFEIQVPPPNALEVNVVGKQWMWKLQHQTGQREINELHIPVGRAIKLTLASEDVIHSFYIPAFRVKQDVVPGRFVVLWFEPKQVGEFHLFCAEYCGTEHSGMIGKIHVLPQPEYETWLSRGHPGETLAQSGARLFRNLGCTGCHVGQGTVRAPRLEGLYGKIVPLQNRQFVRADDAYLRDSILLPLSQIRAGYEPLMPTYQGHISEEELFQLIAYLKTLTSEPTEGQP